MTAPLDLDAVREQMAGGNCLRPRTAVALVAEVERLRVENETLAHEVMAHQTTSDYARGHEHGTLAGTKARNVVPRSALVAVLAELDAEHYPEPDRPWGCVICWPKDGSWPCVTRLAADELRAIVEREDGDE